MKGPLDELTSHFETETMAARERLSQSVTRFVQSNESELERLSEEWKKGHKEMLRLSEMQMLAAAAQLRLPVIDSVKLMTAEIETMERRARGVVTRLENDARRQSELSFHRVERFIEASRYTALYLIAAFVAGLGLGVLWTRLGFL